MSSRAVELAAIESSRGRDLADGLGALGPGGDETSDFGAAIFHGRSGHAGRRDRARAARRTTLDDDGELATEQDFAGSCSGRSGRSGRELGEGPSDHFLDRKSTRLNSSHANISYAVVCLKKKTDDKTPTRERLFPATFYSSLHNEHSH